MIIIKKVYSIVTRTIFLLIFIFVIKANALLNIDTNYDSVIRDDRGTEDINDDLLWIRDLSLGTNMTYYQQITMINELSICGGGWSMATKEQWKTHLTLIISQVKKYCYSFLIE